MATAPWSALVALAGQKQVLLYNTENLAISGILAYDEGFIESLTFSRNGKLIIASGGRGGKSGNVVGWNVETGRRVLTIGDEQDSVLTSDISADQPLNRLETRGELANSRKKKGKNQIRDMI